MNSWFRQFHGVLQGNSPPDELLLIPAGSASVEQMLQHVRYQFSSKTREAVEETFPKVIERMGSDQWEEVWADFQRTKPASPRSLDEYPDVFQQYFANTDAPHALKELMKFEWAIEIHSWHFNRLDRIDLPVLELTNDLKIQLAPLDIQYFAAPVMALYEGYEVFADYEPQTVVIWLTDEGVRFRRLDAWEEQVMQGLGESLGQALQHAPDDSTAVTEFFQWLGSSGLIRQLS